MKGRRSRARRPAASRPPARSPFGEDNSPGERAQNKMLDDGLMPTSGVYKGKAFVPQKRGVRATFESPRTFQVRTEEGIASVQHVPKYPLQRTPKRGGKSILQVPNKPGRPGRGTA